MNLRKAMQQTSPELRSALRGISEDYHGRTMPLTVKPRVELDRVVAMVANDMGVNAPKVVKLSRNHASEASTYRSLIKIGKKLVRESDDDSLKSTVAHELEHLRPFNKLLNSVTTGIAVVMALGSGYMAIRLHPDLPEIPIFPGIAAISVLFQRFMQRMEELRVDRAVTKTYGVAVAVKGLIEVWEKDDGVMIALRKGLNYTDGEKIISGRSSKIKSLCKRLAQVIDTHPSDEKRLINILAYARGRDITY